MVTEKKWSLILSEIERSAAIERSIHDCEVLLNQFESIDEAYRNRNAVQIYSWMWKIALKCGKLSMANSYAKRFLSFLIEYKRIPQIKIFIESLLEEGLFKKNVDEYSVIQDILTGKLKKISHQELQYLDLFSTHPDHWKSFQVFLQQYLVLDSSWGLEQWRFCYEYILFHSFDKEIFLILLEKTRELKNKTAEKHFMELLKSKHIKFLVPKKHTAKKQTIVKENLNLDYDQIAMDLLSGSREPNVEEQTRVINSLKFIADVELLVRGQEMIVAFELLGMEQVVHVLCEKMLTILTDVKERASTYYVWAQALSNNGDFYKAIELIDKVLATEPLISSEKMAFLYLKAEACLKLNKIKMAKSLYLEIKKENPNYRLVGERLKTIETA